MTIGNEVRKNQLKIGVVLSYVNILIGNLIPLFYTPIMLELLGQSEYGLYRLASSAASYLSLASFGIGSAVTRYLIKARIEGGKDAEENIFGLFNVIFQVIAVVTCVAGSLITRNLGLFYGESLTATELQRMKLLVILLTANTALGFSASSYNAVVTSHERFLFLQTVNILTTCVMPVANLVALYMGYASVGMVISSLMINILIRILYVIYVRNALELRPRYHNMPVQLVKEILMFSFWAFMGSVVSQLYNATDIMIIGAIPALATVGVAIYNIGSVFNNMVFSMALAVSTLFAPKANKLVFSGMDSNGLTDFIIRVGRYQCYVISLVCSGFVAFGKQFITWYVGTEYIEAYWIAVLMMIPSCIPLVQSAALSVIQAQNKHQFRSVVYLGIAILNVIGTYILVHNYGIVGAAFMTGLANVIGQGIFMNWYYWKRIGLDIPRFWRHIIKIEGIPVLMCITTLILGNYLDFTQFPVMTAGILSYTIVYLLLEWKLTLLPEERAGVLNVLKKFAKQKNGD